MYPALLVRGEVQPRKICQRKSRTADDNPFRKLQQSFWLLPAAQVQKAVCTAKVKESRIAHCLAQGSQRLDGIVWRAVRSWCVQVGGGKTRIGAAGKFHHRQPIGKGGWPTIGLQRLTADWGKDDLVQVKYIRRGSSDRDVAVMRWIEAAAEKGYPHRLSLANRAHHD